MFRQKNKIYFLIITLLLAVALLAGCTDGVGSGAGGPAGEAPGDPAGENPGGGNGGAADTLKGTTAEILQQILDGAAGGQLPASFSDPVTAENAPAMLGLLPDDFVSFAEEATGAIGALITDAFQAALIKCNNADDALIVSAIIQSGFDSGKWIEVFPERSLTMVSGSYVLLAVGSRTETEALAEAFKAVAGGNVSDPVVFYEGETGGVADSLF